MLSPPMTRLEERLRELDPELFGRYQSVLGVARDLMPRAYATFPTYTDHAVTHTHRVVEVMDHICPDAVRESLTPVELFVLLAGGILHDIGMVTPTALEGDRADDARTGHDVYGAEKILRDPETYGVPRNLRDVVANLIRHHRSSNISTDVMNQPVGVGGTVRLRLLCALLRAGDELHLTEDRAPDVILQNLALPDDSVQHFVNCRSVTGIAVQEPGSEVLVLHATVEDTTAERGVARVIEKVNEELERLHPVFEEYGIPAYRVEPQLNRQLLIPNEVLLLLCEYPEGVTAHELGERLGEGTLAVGDAIRSLRLRGLARETEPGTGRFQAVRGDAAVFQDVSARFLNTDDDLRFLRSPYAQEMIAEVIFPWLREGFSAPYTPMERSTRLSVLQQSPSALHLALTASKVGRTPSVLSRRVLLDLLLLSGLMSDVYLRPEIAEGLDIGSAVDELGRHVSSRVEGFARLISRAWSYRAVSSQEMGQRMTAGMDSGLPDGALNVRGEVSVEFPQEPAFLSFPHLMVAALEEMVPLEVAAPQLQSVAVSREGEPLLPEGYRPDQVTYQPHRRRPPVPTPQTACRFEFDEARSVCKIVLDQERSFDQPLFPDRLEITDVSQFPVQKFRILDNLGPTSCRNALEKMKLERVLAAEGQCTIEILDPATRAVVETQQVHSQTAEVSSEGHRLFQAVEILAAAEGRLEAVIPPPNALTAAQLDAIVAQRDRLTSAEVDEVRAALGDVAALETSELTRFRITVFGDGDRPVVDWYPRVAFGAATPSLPQGSEEQQVAFQQTVIEHGWHTKYWTEQSPREVAETFLATLDRGGIEPPCCDDAQAVGQAEVTYIVHPMTRTTWGAEHIVQLLVRTQPDHRHLLDLAQEAMTVGAFEKAQDLLTDCIVAEPTLAITHAQLGYAFYENKQLEAARRSFRNALELSGGLSSEQQANLVCCFGLISLHHGQLDRALREYERALEMVPNLDLGDAISHIEAKLPANIHAPSAHYAAAWLLDRSGDSGRAASHLRSFLAAVPSDLQAFTAVAQETLARLEAAGAAADQESGTVGSGPTEPADPGSQ